jgi:glycosyltransferase involved in cell wall biosynthesis
MAKNSVRLSVVIITKNEEKNIERCLLSVQDIADEIVVVDSYSTDQTESICKKYHVLFIKHPFEGHIQQKNFALTKTLFPHVLSLDADECLSEKLKEEIKAIKIDFQYDGYMINRLTNYCGKWIRHSGWYPDKKLRLFNKEKGQWTGDNPHDRFELQPSASLSRIRADILHYSFYTIDQHLDTIKSFSGIAAQTKFEKGQKAGYAKLLLRPAWKFFRNYFIKGGFLDGFYGLVVCSLSSYATFLRYAKLKQMIKTKHLENSH